MKINLYVIGSLKERYWKEAVAEYSKRLGGYCQLAVREFPDLPTKEKASAKEIEEIKEKEGKRIMDALAPGEYLIALDFSGKEYGSEAFSAHLEEVMVHHGAGVSFLIGGSLGISKTLLSRANEALCLGKMTYPHQLARVILLEQLYRSFRIAKGEPYHK